MINVNKKITCHLRHRRMEKHLTQKDLAQLSGINQAHLSRIELGKVIPSLELAFKLAATLECKIEDIFTPEKEQFTP